MPLTFNIRHLHQKDLAFQGELPVEELDLEDVDALIHPIRPLEYEFKAEVAGDNILVRGWMRLVLRCECVRCLKAFEQPLEFADWICSLPLTGEDKALVDNDVVDLTPYLREDILLEFPQHPLCGEQCQGLPEMRSGQSPEGSSQPRADSSVWDELDKLKL